MKAYLAGPEVFFEDCHDAGARKRRICAAHGVEGLYPLDGDPDASASVSSTSIFAANLAMIRSADVVIANLTPFRGISADVGTVWEVGAAFALGKPVYGYSNDPRPLFDRTADAISRADLRVHLDGRPMHPDGMSIENFGLADNLMIEESISASGGAFFAPENGAARDIADLDLFETCVRAAVAARDQNRPRAGT